MSFVTEAAAQAEVAAHVEQYLDVLNTHPDTPEGYSFTAQPSGKNYRIVMAYKGQDKSVHAFVNRTTGDIFKPAGWKAPAKHVRGNVTTSLDEYRTTPKLWNGGYLYLR